MREIEWYFPRSLAEVPPLLVKNGVIAHGGGTGILRMKILRQSGRGGGGGPEAAGVRGLIDLGRLPIRHFERLGGRVEMGAGLTFAEVAERLEPDHILARALGRSASTPLRNRITVGGSVALFPVWSDLMGPLIALEADVNLIGGKEGTFPIASYISDPGLRRGTLITGVSFRDQAWSSRYYRDTRTSFDYAAFTITILLKKGAGKLLDARIVVVGCTGKFRRLNLLEERLKGKPIGEGGPISFPELSFTGKKFMSPEYLARCARVELERGLDALRRE
jgi:CO/xanthine dehydrogenase FAD-binding subunit